LDLIDLIPELLLQIFPLMLYPPRKRSEGLC